jgi:hypothetical protein
MMTDREKSVIIKKPKKKSSEKKSKTRSKSRNESDNTKPKKKHVARPNSKDRRLNKENSCKKSPKSKNEEDLFCWNFRKRSNKWTTADKNTTKKFRKENAKEESNFRTSRKLPDCFD